MPVMRRALVPEVLPGGDPDPPRCLSHAARAAAGARPAVPAAPGPAGEGRAALAAALAGPVPGAQRKAPGSMVLPGDDGPLTWDDAGLARFCGFLRSMSDHRDHRGRRIPLHYLTAVAVAGPRGRGRQPGGRRGVGRVGPSPGPAPARRPARRVRQPRRPDAATFSRVLGRPPPRAAGRRRAVRMVAARARDLRPGIRRHLRVDGKALRGAARGGRAPMLLSGIWDDGTTAAQLPVSKKSNEIPVFRDLLEIPRPGDPKDAVILGRPDAHPAQAREEDRRRRRLLHLHHRR